MPYQGRIFGESFAKMMNYSCKTKSKTNYFLKRAKKHHAQCNVALNEFVLDSSVFRLLVCARKGVGAEKRVGKDGLWTREDEGGENRKVVADAALVDGAKVGAVGFCAAVGGVWEEKEG